MKVESIYSNGKNNKKYTFYCVCGFSVKLKMGRHWHNCANPPFQMTNTSPAESKRQENAIKAFFNSV